MSRPAPLGGLRPRADTVYVSRSRTVLVIGHDGFIAEGTRQGLFQHQTRLLSRYRWLVDDRPPSPSGLSPLDEHAWLGYYAVHIDEDAERRNEAPGTVELRVSRVVGDGLHEDVVVTNHHHRPTMIHLALEADGDFADVADVDAGNPRRYGRISRTHRRVEGAAELTLTWDAARIDDHEPPHDVIRLRRSVTVRVAAAGVDADSASGRIGIRLTLSPHASWRACVRVLPVIDGVALVPEGCAPSSDGSSEEHERRHAAFLRGATRVEVGGAASLAFIVARTVEQAARDLAALRLYDLDANERDWVPAAGAPIYVALFGRDSLTAAWQAALLGPSMMRGALAAIAARRGRRIDDWRDEQPDRLLHQEDTGPLAALDITPFGHYYGSVTTPVFFPIVLSELWHWTGDRALVAELLDTARRALRWLDEYGDVDGDGLYEYETSSEGGLRNQGWKDSGAALVLEDGSLARAPIATCEEQALAYLAKFRMAELLWAFDGASAATAAFAEARELRRRFNERFWIDDMAFYAMALDRDKRAIRSVSSDVGIALSTGVVDADRVPRVVERLFADDLFSGWGIRTLSSAHVAYDPFSYQRGSVWVVEHGAIALALARYGFHDALQRLARAQFEVAAMYEGFRLPELFAGHPRDDAHPFPGQYTRANWPQAWSASTVFCLLQAMTGLYPYAPLQLLLLDPHLPTWLPDLTLRGLHVGDASVDLRFRREPDGDSTYEVLEVRGTLHVVRQPSPWSFTAGPWERVSDALMSLLPGH